MESILTVFECGSSQGRYFIDEHGDLWFALTDVLTIAKTSTDTTQAQTLIEDVFDDDSKIVRPIPDSMGRPQDTIFIHESAFTFLVSRFRTEAGKKLNRFIHKELLPTIRKTGGYISKGATKEQLEGLQAQIEELQKQNELLATENKILENHSDQLGFIADFLGCNFVFALNKYVMSQDVLARFRKWAAPTTSDLFTDTQILRLIDEHNKRSPLTKNKRFYMKANDGGYGDLENAQIVPMKQAKNNTCLRICAVGE